MAFRPDTKYYIGSKEYDTIYEAFDAVRTMAKGTVIKDKNGTTVFTKDNNSNTYHLYQFNEYYGESADQNYSSGEVLPGLTNNSYGKMLTWLNNFAYSTAMVSSLTAELGRSLDTAMFPSKPFMKKSRRRRLAATILWRPFLPHMTGSKIKLLKLL